MKAKIAINGAGRIGLLFLRQKIDMMINEKDDSEIVLMNDPFASLDNLIYRLTYDSVHGKFPHSLAHCSEKMTLTIAGKYTIKFTQVKDPQEIPYKEHGVNMVVECSGAFTSYEKALLHYNQGKLDDQIKAVVVSAPAAGDKVKTIVYGVNHEEYNAGSYKVVSNASCTTNCLAPIVKVLDAKYGIVKGLMTTTHAATATQKTVDGISPKNWADGRTVFGNIIPSSTGAAKAIGLVFPHLQGKLDGMALRVPTPDVSVVDFVCEIKGKTTKEEVLAEFKKAAEGSMKNLLAIAHEGAVSLDFVGDTHSSIVDPKNLMVMGDNMVKVIAYYDNEMGYSRRLADQVRYIASKN